MQLSLILAADVNHAIGKGGKLPWHLPEDLKFFKKMTDGKPIIMGRKTYESIGRPLPNRTNIVLTRDESFSATGVLTVNSKEEALELAAKNLGETDEAMVIGGAEIYNMFLPEAHRIYLTRVYTEVKGADAHFPIDDHAWHQVEMERHENEPDGLNFTFFTLERK